MNRRSLAVLFGLLAVVPLAAQQPAGWKMRVDRSTSASDPERPHQLLWPETDGIYGIRVNHLLNVTITDFRKK